MAYESEDSGHLSGQESVLPSVSAPTKSDEFVKGSGQKPYVCPETGCKAAFSRPWRLKAHVSKHRGETPFNCDHPGCSRSYTSQNHLTRHLKTTHREGYSSAKTYKCPHEGCAAELKTNQNLNKHIKRAHIGSKKCTYCDETFVKVVQLKYHMQIHTGEFLHSCAPCKLKFTRKTEYNRHMRSHKIYLCGHESCSFAFETWSAMRKHLQTHRPNYICYYCSKPSFYKVPFRNHVLTHLPDAPKRNILKEYTCHHCSHTISGKQSLRRHMRVIHLNPKPKKPPKSGKARKERSDKGHPTEAMAFHLIGVERPPKESRALVESRESEWNDAVEAVGASIFT